MTLTADTPTAAPQPTLAAELTHDHRGSWIPTGRMIAARFHELRRRRGTMATLAVVTIGIPAVYLAIRLILHAASPDTYGPAGGFAVYVGMVTLVLYVFGFIVAATLGATAGSVDLSEGMFRHHVITGRSRMALYLARIPAGLSIIWAMVAVGFAVVCTVCVFAAPTTLNYDGVNVPVGLSETALEQWAAANASSVVNNFPVNFSPTSPPVSPGCLGGGGPGPGVGGAVVKQPAGQAQTSCTPAQMQAEAVQLAKQDYSDYQRIFLSPPLSLMVKTGLWIELEASIGFLVGLGLASLVGQRTVSTVLLIILEVILTPIASRAQLPHMINLQRAIVGVATAHVEPGNLPLPFGGGSLQDQTQFIHESTGVAVCVIVAWIVVWTALGAWRMMTRDA
jgi:hypothetical protein